MPPPRVPDASDARAGAETRADASAVTPRRAPLRVKHPNLSKPSPALSARQREKQRQIDPPDVAAVRTDAGPLKASRKRARRAATPPPLPVPAMEASSPLSSLPSQSPDYNRVDTSKGQSSSSTYDSGLSASEDDADPIALWPHVPETESEGESVAHAFAGLAWRKKRRRAGIDADALEDLRKRRQQLASTAPVKLRDSPIAPSLQADSPVQPGPKRRTESPQPRDQQTDDREEGQDSDHTDDGADTTVKRPVIDIARFAFSEANARPRKRPSPQPQQQRAETASTIPMPLGPPTLSSTSTSHFAQTAPAVASVTAASATASEPSAELSTSAAAAGKGKGKGKAAVSTMASSRAATTSKLGRPIRANEPVHPLALDLMAPSAGIPLSTLASLPHCPVCLRPFPKAQTGPVRARHLGSCAAEHGAGAGVSPSASTATAAEGAASASASPARAAAEALELSLSVVRALVDAELKRLIAKDQARAAQHEAGLTLYERVMVPHGQKRRAKAPQVIPAKLAAETMAAAAAAANAQAAAGTAGAATPALSGPEASTSSTRAGTAVRAPVYRTSVFTTLQHASVAHAKAEAAMRAVFASPLLNNLPSDPDPASDEASGADAPLDPAAQSDPHRSPLKERAVSLVDLEWQIGSGALQIPCEGIGNEVAPQGVDVATVPAPTLAAPVPAPEAAPAARPRTASSTARRGGRPFGVSKLAQRQLSARRRLGLGLDAHGNTVPGSVAAAEASNSMSALSPSRAQSDPAPVRPPAPADAAPAPEGEPPAGPVALASPRAKAPHTIAVSAPATPAAATVATPVRARSTAVTPASRSSNGMSARALLLSPSLAISFEAKRRSFALLQASDAAPGDLADEDQDDDEDALFPPSLAASGRILVPCSQ